MDFIIFGDDWGGHASTTQHLVRHFFEVDRVIWVDSIGMRTPRLNRKDLTRLKVKACSLTTKKAARQLQQKDPETDCEITACQFFHIAPMVVPFHQNNLCRFLNKWILQIQILRAMKLMGMAVPNILSANPVVANYIQGIPYRKLAYLRLDRYAELPGVDRDLILEVEPLMFDQAALIFATARKLIPQQTVWEKKSYYLPQGVDTVHFAQASCEPSRKKILGFFGLVAEWLDFTLIEMIATNMQDWILEFRGPIRCLPERLKKIKNVRWLPPVPFNDLPFVMKDWACAWIPFQVSALTESVNPLKIREYLAAGLASHCTSLPEVYAMKNCPGVFISDSPQEIEEWMESCFHCDSREKRIKIRAGVTDESWTNRVIQLQRVITQG